MRPLVLALGAGFPLSLEEEILAVKREILNVSDSVRAGNVTLDMINRQLLDECDLMTDWARRDRG